MDANKATIAMILFILEIIQVMGHSRRYETFKAADWMFWGTELGSAKPFIY
jgi:hypothetical protein